MKTTEMPSSNCPWCNKEGLDAATDPYDESSPVAGDISVCAYCMGLLEYDQELKLIKIRDDTFIPEEMHMIMKELEDLKEQSSLQ